MLDGFKLKVSVCGQQMELLKHVKKKNHTSISVAVNVLISGLQNFLKLNSMNTQETLIVLLSFWIGILFGMLLTKKGVL